MRAVTSEDAQPIDPILRGELVYLAASEPEHVVERAQAISGSEVGHYLGIKSPLSRDAAERFAKELLGQVGKTLFSFNIMRIEDAKLVGAVDLRDIDRENGSAEVAIFVGDPSLFGRGLGTDALRCVLDFGFGEQRLERIQLHVFDYNTRAKRSYEKAGFQTDAVLRRARFHRGAHHDVLVMSILRDEWLAQDRRRAWDPPSS
jgi:RimJ/RimL family protein N-acetyltransferase